MAENTLEAHLYECLKKGNTKKALYILKLLGDNVNKIYKGRSPLLWAEKFENDEVIKALKEKGAKKVISEEYEEKLKTELLNAAERNDLDNVIELINNDANLDVKTKNNETPLIRASYKGYIKIANELIKAGAKLDEIDTEGNTALIYASDRGYTEIVKELIKAGANLDLQSKRIENTALMRAVYRGHIEIIKELVEAGANVELSDKNGWKTIDMAGSDEAKKAIRSALMVRKGKKVFGRFAGIFSMDK